MRMRVRPARPRGAYGLPYLEDSEQLTILDSMCMWLRACIHGREDVTSSRTPDSGHEPRSLRESFFLRKFMFSLRRLHRRVVWEHRDAAVMVASPRKGYTAPAWMGKTPPVLRLADCLPGTSCPLYAPSPIRGVARPGVTSPATVALHDRERTASQQRQVLEGLGAGMSVQHITSPAYRQQGLGPSESERRERLQRTRSAAIEDEKQQTLEWRNASPTGSAGRRATPHTPLRLDYLDRLDAPEAAATPPSSHHTAVTTTPASQRPPRGRAGGVPAQAIPRGASDSTSSRAQLAHTPTHTPAASTGRSSAPRSGRTTPRASSSSSSHARTARSSGKHPGKHPLHTPQSVPRAAERSPSTPTRVAPTGVASGAPHPASSKLATTPSYITPYRPPWAVRAAENRAAARAEAERIEAERQHAALVRACLKTQAAWRGQVGRRRAHSVHMAVIARNRAAGAMQGKQRCKMARREVARRRAEAERQRLEAEERRVREEARQRAEGGSTALQAAWRGAAERRRRSLRRNEAIERTVARAAAAERLARGLQGWWRRKWFRLLLKVRKANAAIVVQKWYRGVLAVRLMLRLRTRREQRRAAAFALAMRLQRLQRRRLAVRELDRRRAALAAKRRADRQHAATRLQAFQRGRQARHHFLELWDAYREPDGLKWVRLGKSRPAVGNELQSAQLRDALKRSTEFTKETIRRMKLKGLKGHSFIKVGDIYFKPAPVTPTCWVTMYAAKDDVHAMFLRWDRDGDGRIDAHELRDGLVELGLNVSTRHAQRIMRHYVEHGDPAARVGLTEFRKVIAELRGYMEQRGVG